MTFGVDPLGRLGYAAESLVLNATEFDVAGNDPTILVKWYASTNTYWYKPPNKLTYLNSGHSSASRIVNWLSNVLTLTKGKSIEFKSLGPNDTDQPIDCEMFAWGSWSNWSDCADGQQIRTRTRAVKTPAANGGTACPTDLEQTESRACDSSTDDGADTDTDTDTDIDPIKSLEPEASPSLPSWAIPAGVGGAVLILILALK